MKTLKIWSVLACLMMVSFGFVSCSDDEDGGNVDASNLYGIWEIVRDQGYFYEDGERISFDEPIGDEYCEFSEDGSGNFLGINCDWNLSGNRLAISVYGESMIFTVTSLTAAELIIEVSGRDGDGEYYEKFTMRKVD